MLGLAELTRGGVVGRTSGRITSLTAWCSAAAGTILMLVGTLLPDRLVIPALVAGLVLVAVGAGLFSVRLLRG